MDNLLSFVVAPLPPPSISVMFSPGERNVASLLQDAQDGSAEGPWAESVVAASPSHELEDDLAGLLGSTFQHRGLMCNSSWEAEGWARKC